MRRFTVLLHRQASRGQAHGSYLTLRSVAPRRAEKWARRANAVGAGAGANAITKCTRIHVGRVRASASAAKHASGDYTQYTHYLQHTL